MGCKHERSVYATNWGIKITNCTLFCKLVNQEVCDGCPAREGETPPVPIELDFPRRPQEEIDRVYAICKGCPFFDENDKTCNKLRSIQVPVDTYAQNPQHGCPVGLW